MKKTLENQGEEDFEEVILINGEPVNLGETDETDETETEEA